MVADAHLHPGSRPGPSPDGQGAAALQNGVILEERSELESHRRVDIVKVEGMTFDIFLANGVDEENLPPKGGVRDLRAA
jgi:hypothetical protein